MQKRKVTPSEVTVRLCGLAHLLFFCEVNNHEC